MFNIRGSFEVLAACLFFILLMQYWLRFLDYIQDKWRNREPQNGSENPEMLKPGQFDSYEDYEKELNKYKYKHGQDWRK